MEDYEKIELRSEKIRHIIGQVPSRIIRSGITILSIIVALMLAVSYYIPYPETLSTTSVFANNREVELFIPYSEITRIKTGLPVLLELEGYPKNQFGVLRGSIAALDSTIVTIGGINYFCATVPLEKKEIELLKPVKGMKAMALITVNKQTIFQRIFSGLKHW